MSVKSVDEYLANIRPSQRKELERVRKIIKQTLPEAEEIIRYSMPTYNYKGKRLISFAAFTNHMSLFGNLGEMESKLSNYKLSNKGTLQFTEINGLPDDTIRQILLHRIAVINNN